MFNDVETTGLTISTKTIARTLLRTDFGECRLSETPLLMPRRLKARSAFAKRYLEHDNDWKSILWSDETKIELFVHKDSYYVWEKAGEVLNPKNTLPILKYGVGRIML